MGWGNAEVQKQHMMLVCWCWKVRVPKRRGPPHGPITTEVADAVWEAFKKDPKSEATAVVSMKHYANQEFLAYVQAN